MKRIGGVLGILGLVFSLAGNTAAASQRVSMKLTLPGGQQVKVVEVEGQMASVKSESLYLGLTPKVKGDLVAVAIYRLDAAGKPAEKPLATVTGPIGEPMTLKFEPGSDELRIVPEKVY